jgi:competence protein ComEA
MEKLQPFLRWLAVAIAAGALAFAFFAPHRQDAGTAADDAPTPPAVLTAAASSPDAPTPADVTATPPPTPATLAVYVCGAVRKAGVYRLPQGSRVVDAVSLAGGLAGDADPEAVNLASPLSDGMKVDILKKGAPATFEASDNGAVDNGAVDLYGRPATSNTHRTSRRSSSRGSSHKLQPGQTLDINTATEAELLQLPGVGPSLARRIVEYREANGPFDTVDDLQNVSGIGPSKFAKMEPFVRL